MFHLDLYTERKQAHRNYSAEGSAQARALDTGNFNTLEGFLSSEGTFKGKSIAVLIFASRSSFLNRFS